jgi:hypothetical protein
MFDHLVWKLGYLALVAAVIAIEHKRFARRWKRYERARWTMGVATVLGLATPLAMVGWMDWATWCWLMAGFGVAGAMTTLLYLNEGANVNAIARKALRKASQTDK